MKILAKFLKKLRMNLINAQILVKKNKYKKIMNKKINRNNKSHKNNQNNESYYIFKFLL